ncbi:hypothetical protein [Bartonella rattimassiliensis]|uniref:hypothetical protein n=1 Tax=Bartonella rattimassiliensis TaxID=270250 RepID=UPI0003783C19|nr:hypothetical protein [Bartonella rattimassiliensis]
MGLIEVVLIVVCVTLGSLLFSGMSLLCALSYSEKVKVLKKQVHSLKQQIDEYEKTSERNDVVTRILGKEVKLRDTEIERLTQELKQRGESVKEKSHKNKKKSK